tara:strand:+ start:2803 stop:3330 length:528 start_codon:yes stop_codon:yes gene_type:complete
MIKVTIDSIRVSLMTQHRVAILKEDSSERYLPIWIGPCEADSITVRLQNLEMARPLTHDILAQTISDLGGNVLHVSIHDLRNDVFYASIVIEQNSEQIELDARPSDALALAVRTHIPIFVTTEVMEKASITPEDDITYDNDTTNNLPEEESNLSAFSDFVDSLDLDNLDSKTGQE